MQKKGYVVLEAEICGMPWGVLVAEEIFEENGWPPAQYFPENAENATKSGTATIEIDAAFSPYVLKHLPPN